jgi:hypothetical protein
VLMMTEAILGLEIKTVSCIMRITLLWG